MENCGNVMVSFEDSPLGRDVKAVWQKEKLSGKYFIWKNIICDVLFHFIISIYSAYVERRGNSYNSIFGAAGRYLRGSDGK